MNTWERGSEETSAEWLNRLVEDKIVLVSAVQVVLGVNTFRVYEWLSGEKEMPAEAEASLAHWFQDGRPQFAYWIKANG